MGNVRYIVKKRMREAGISGRVNLPYGTEVEAVDGLIIHQGAAVCAVTSRKAHLYFARDDDGQGRGAGRPDAGHYLQTGETGQRPSRPLGSGGRTPPARNTGGQTMRIISCGAMNFSRRRWRTCGISRD